jgi:hypothetical protein
MKRKSPEDDENLSTSAKKLKTANTQDPLSNKDIFDNLIAPFMWSEELNAFQQTCKKFNDRHHNGSAAWVNINLRDIRMFETVRSEFSFKSAKRFDVQTDKSIVSAMSPVQVSALSAVAKFRCGSKLQELNFFAANKCVQLDLHAWTFHAPQFGLFDVQDVYDRSTSPPRKSSSMKQLACLVCEVCMHWDTLSHIASIDTLVIDETVAFATQLKCTKHRRTVSSCVVSLPDLPSIRHLVVRLQGFAGRDECQDSPLPIDLLAARLPNLEDVKYYGMTYRHERLLLPTMLKLSKLPSKPKIDVSQLWMFHYESRDFKPCDTFKEYLKEP